MSGVNGAEFETSAALELELRQLWPASATMAGMSQLWAKMGLIILNNTTKTKRIGPTKGQK